MKNKTLSIVFFIVGLLSSFLLYNHFNENFSQMDNVGYWLITTILLALLILPFVLGLSVALVIVYFKEDKLVLLRSALLNLYLVHYLSFFVLDLINTNTSITLRFLFFSWIFLEILTYTKLNNFLKTIFAFLLSIVLVTHFQSQKTPNREFLSNYIKNTYKEDLKDFKGEYSIYTINTTKGNSYSVNYHKEYKHFGLFQKQKISQHNTRRDFVENYKENKEFKEITNQYKNLLEDEVKKDTNISNLKFSIDTETRIVENFDYEKYSNIDVKTLDPKDLLKDEILSIHLIFNHNPTKLSLSQQNDWQAFFRKLSLTEVNLPDGTYTLEDLSWVDKLLEIKVKDKKVISKEIKSTNKFSTYY